jgi:photosystem II stability/assembly factor-like uncharacterized protein
LTAQPWMETYQDGKTPLNFYDIRQKFNAYWDGKELDRGKGWKAFKRWEWYWENRVGKDGLFPPAGLALENFNQYIRQNRNGDRNIQANWQVVGPDFTIGGYAGLGRINCVGFDPVNTNIIYAGAAGGGLWKSMNGGNSWFTTTDNLASIGVSGIAIHPVNPNIIYIATGDGDAFDTYSIGVLKSEDGGLTFSATGLNWSTSNNRVIRRILMDPDDPNILLIASSNGIYRTINAGTSWTQVQTGNFYDLEAKPGSSANTWYAATAGAVWRSVNDGVSWSSVFTISGSNRISLAVTPANPSYVYAISSLSTNSGFNGLFRSVDSGASFTSRSTTPNILGWTSNGSDAGGQGWYDLALAADPANAETIYAGGVNTWKSTNGGSSLALRSHWSGASGVQTVHADKHVLEFQGTSVLWEGNDGGLYRSPDGGVKWEHKTNGMVISQLYRIAVAQTSSRIIGGYQDNGTKIRDPNGTWRDVIGGDGMDCAIKNTDHNVLYGELYYGELRRSTNGGSNWTDIHNNIPGAPEGAWVTPFELAPSNNNTIIAAYDQIFRSDDQGNTWISIGTTANVGTSKKTILAIAPSSTSVIYTGTTSALWKTTDGGTSWSTITVPGSNISRLIVHPTDPNTIWLVRSNYTAGAKVYKSVNGGSSWTNVSGSLPNIPANCIVYQNGTQNGLYVGMDAGIYYRDDTMSDWDIFNSGMPNAEVLDLKIDYTNNIIYAGTYGRGTWKTELANAVPVCLYPINVTFSNNSTYSVDFSWQINNQSVSGYQFALTTTQTPPASGTFTSDRSVQITGLTSNTSYYFHVRSECSGNVYSQWITIGPLMTSPACGQSFFDSGGSGSNYSNYESRVWTICPNTPCDKVRVTFSAFNVEANYDALYVFNGPSITDLQFSSSNGITSAGFPAGGYYGTTIPGPFTSTHQSGCLTFRFLSDELEVRAGWTSSVSCVSGNFTVTNNQDNGPGSLRDILTCATSGSNITFDPSLANQTIALTTSTLLIDKNVNILLTSSTPINLTTNSNFPILNIQNGRTVHLKYVNFSTGGNIHGRAVINNGTLTLENVEIEDDDSQNAGSTIENNGTLNIVGSNFLLKK